MDKNENKKSQILYPPVVSVLGHVDHGKTTLLDAIRKTNIAQKEYGGITQRIGASTVEVLHEGVKRKITFIDTPGHETFSQMRGRGVQASDIGLLIVSSSDGLMPQTKESIELLQSSNTPFIVVLTKADLPNKNPEKVKQELLKHKVSLEGYGGDIPVIEISALKNQNIKELLELILLIFDIKLQSGSYTSSEKNPLLGIVIESKLDLRGGPKATIIIKDGTVKIRDEIWAEQVKGRVKALVDTYGKSVDKASVGEAVEVLGFEKVPKVGSLVKSKDLEGALSEKTPQKKIFNEGDNRLNVLIVADTQGSLEAIVASIADKVNIISQKTGDIEPSDILFAKSVGGIVLGFNLKIKPQTVQFAQTEKVVLKNYNLIYEMIDEVNDFVEGKKIAEEEKIFGKAKIIARFPYEKTEVLGISVLEGRIAKGDKIRLLRSEDTLGESSISSVRQGKDQVSKVEKGNQAGVLLAPFLDFQVGDVVISHS
jgi:translation initiation factor IF-2